MKITTIKYYFVPARSSRDNTKFLLRKADVPPTDAEIKAWSDVADTAPIWTTPTFSPPHTNEGIHILKHIVSPYLDAKFITDETVGINGVVLASERAAFRWGCWGGEIRVRLHKESNDEMVAEFTPLPQSYASIEYLDANANIFEQILSRVDHDVPISSTDQLYAIVEADLNPIYRAAVFHLHSTQDTPEPGREAIYSYNWIALNVAANDAITTITPTGSSTHKDILYKCCNREAK